MSPRDDEAFWADVADVLETGLKLKKIMQKRGLAAIRRHLAGRAANGARLGAVGVTIENVKLVLVRHAGETSVVTALEPRWPSFGPNDGGGGR